MSGDVLPEEYVLDAMESGELIKIEPWRHGTRQTFVYWAPLEGKHWMFTVDVHHTEGVQLFGPVPLVEVNRVERTVKVWEEVGK